MKWMTTPISSDNIKGITLRDPDGLEIPQDEMEEDIFIEFFVSSEVAKLMKEGEKPQCVYADLNKNSWGESGCEYHSLE